MAFVLVHFEGENSYDVKSASSLKQVEENADYVLGEGDSVDVKYGSRYYQAALISVSENKDELLAEMNKKIGASSTNKENDKKKGKKQTYASQARQLLKEIGQQAPNRAPESLSVQNERLQNEVSRLKRKLALQRKN